MSLLLIAVLLATDLQRVERTTLEVSGVVEKERFPRGVEECNHKVAEVLHL